MIVGSKFPTIQTMKTDVDPAKLYLILIQKKLKVTGVYVKSFKHITRMYLTCNICIYIRIDRLISQVWTPLIGVRNRVGSLVDKDWRDTYPVIVSNKGGHFQHIAPNNHVEVLQQLQL